MESPPRNFKNYAQWRKAVDRIFKSQRPDVDISELDKNFLWESFTKGTSPSDFVVKTNLKFESVRDAPLSTPIALQEEPAIHEDAPHPSDDYACPHCEQIAVTETIVEEASKIRNTMQGLGGISLLLGVLLVMVGWFGLWIDVLGAILLVASFVLFAIQACFPHSVTLAAIRSCHACGRSWRVEDGVEQPQMLKDGEIPSNVAVSEPRSQYVPRS